MMKFVIWGAGFRGKNICTYLGNDRIVAFIDKSVDMQGKCVEDRPVISYEEYKEKYNKIPVIISPILYVDEIKACLERDGISYFVGYSLPPQIIENPNADKVVEFQNYILQEVSALDTVPLWGVSLYSVLVYELLDKNGISTYIVNENSESDICRILINNGFLVQTKLNHNSVCITEQNDKDIFDRDVTCIELYDLKKYYINPKIACYKNIHEGQRCFIVATGPSLTMADLETLCCNKEVCFSMNGIIKLYHQTAWRPNYFLIEDNKGFDEWKDDIIKYTNEVTTFVADWCSTSTVPADKINVYHLSKVFKGEKQVPEFSEDFSVECFWSSTVSYECIQLACYMGFKEIIFVGLDFNYSLQFNHFSNDYHSSEKAGQMDHSKELEKMHLGFTVANEYAKKHDIKILNASRHSCLDVFEKVDFDTLF